MKWITATDLGRWGESIPARTELPGLVGDLIRATAEGITAFRFPSGDKGQVRGFDGHLLAGKGSTYVPEGRSYWEFGATKAQASKFGEDIGKRSDQVSEDDQKDVTFVFVTPQTWDKPQQKIEDAVKACREASRWKDVRYIDGVQLESWLDEAPAVAATHARLTLRTKPQIGARSSEEFWESYSGRFRVDLTEEVLLCEREEHAQQLLDHIKGRNGILTFTADSPDEVIAFAVAAIRKASAEERLFLEARTLIVDSEEAAFELRAADKLAFLTRDRAVPHAGMLSRVGPTVVGVGYDQKRGNDNFLGNPSFHAMGKALATMEGISEDGGLMLARRAGRSVTILARTIPRGAPENPAWLAEGRALVPSLLAGGWNGASDDDRRIVGMLTADGDYTRLEEALRPLCRTQDAPIDLFGDVWQMRSPVDAFVHLGHLITRADLERLERAVTEVFGTIVPEQEEDEPFSLSGRQDAGYSSWVRTGLSTTLLHLAVLAEQANFSVAGVRPQHFVNDLISGLPGLTTDARLLISIRDELPVLMEAAPDPLLAALEHLLGGNEGAVAPLLKEKEGFLSSSSPLTHVLWALERMAWDPKYLERTSLLLAQLAERDPGGRLSNRPINSLQTIFLAWLPSTHARLEQRLAALDTLVSQHNGVGWELLLKLLPKNSSATSLTIKPRYRDAGASARATLTVGDVRRTYVYVINRALELASDEPNRWLSLIGEFDDFPLEMRRRFYERLEPHFQTLQGEERRKAWEAVRDKVARHRSFAHAAWALPEDELQVLDTLLAANQPAAALDRHRWLFDEWFPDVSGDSKEREGKIAEARVAALNDLLAEDYSTVLAAAYAVKLPHTLGQTVAKALSMEAIQQFAEDLYRDQAARSFVIALSSQAFERFGSLWKDFVIGLQRQEGSSSHAIAALLVGWPDRTDTWEFAASLGEATEEQYWLQKQPFRLEGGDADVERAIETYLRLGRPTAALNTASDSFNRLPQALLFSILDNLPSELNAAGQSLDQLSVYLIEQALEALSGRDDVNISDVAAREYQYLEIFRFSDKTLSIHRLMAIDPEFYFSIIMDVFRPSGEEQIEPVTEKQLSRAKSGYRLLSEFKLLPGQDSGTVDYDSLRKWMDRLKALSKEYDRVEITASYIGHVLAHSIADERDGVWPHRSVRRVIEEERSEPLEEGFAVEVFNSRGTYSKAIFEGGRQERALEEQYRESARKIVEPRTSAMLHKIADDYARQAASEDIRAEQDKVARH